jgi:glutamate-1-semialdehyde 2,1-aminomutase
VHVVNFNDLESVEWACERYDVACLITEPLLQNIGVIKPAPGYLEGLRRVADRLGFVLIFDEVKTGFRHAMGGYAAISGVRPDLAVYGKALANGYPIAAIGGRNELMDYFVHRDASKRVLLAGTYNAHPVPTAAAIATIERLLMDGGEIYRHVERLGAQMEDGLIDIFRQLGVEARVARQGSAFCIYFMSHLPVDWHDLAANHDFQLDEAMRRQLIEEGIYFFPLATKQCSISAAHDAGHISRTLECLQSVLQTVVARTVPA